MLKRGKKIVSALLVVAMLPSIIISPASAVANSNGYNGDSSENNSQEFVKHNIQGVALLEDIETEIFSTNDFNSVLEHITLRMEGETAEIEATFEGRVVTFEPQLYQSRLINNAENSIFGIDERVSEGIQLVQFSVEENTEEFSLMLPNLHMIGETVVSLAFYSSIDQITYAYQFVANEISIPKLAETLVDADELAGYELANFGGVPYHELAEEMASLDVDFDLDVEVVGVDEVDTLSTDITSLSRTLVPPASLSEISYESIKENLLFDSYIERSKEGSIFVGDGRGRNLIPGIPNSLYRRQTHGWTTSFGSYVNRVATGYAVFHMPAVGTSRNTLNYVARVQAIYNRNGQDHIHSFMITHNVWIQYIASSNRIFIFDDRPFNARLEFEGTVWMRTPNNENGHFTHNAFSSISSASRLSRVMEAAIIWIPHVSSGRETWSALSSARRATGSWHPISSFSKYGEAKQNKLRRPGDHVTLNLWSSGLRTISYGARFTVRTR
jgi:hypothetical protein